MKRILNWMRSWSGSHQLSKQMSFIEKRINDLQKMKTRSDNEIERHRTYLDKIEDQFTKELKKTNQALDDAVGLNKKYEIAIEAVNEDLKTVNEILIPGLVAANKTFQDTWDAQSANNAMKAAMSRPSEEIE